ncbi:unnamed protein product [Dovyalis caffra]|uniref:Fe2OG dioxygenase domain-containing protein n=1 Tax=Dovyalis caffra TaxID=77055 RepID=A0AAV1RA16_9ROSI|nr:unnamed protein product [Dovyalis caffra]
MENLEWSLPVPSVQDLASQHLETVPTRYLREDMDGLITSTGLASDDSSLRVPLIDMSKLANPESQDIELKKLHAACKDWGIFQVTDDLNRYSQDIRQVAVGLTSFMAMGLEIEGQELCEAYQEGLYHTRMNCYPPCPQPEQVMGITPHADNSGITLLLECGNTPGLQVLKDGHWVFVEPIDGAIVVNTGHITEEVTSQQLEAMPPRFMRDDMDNIISTVPSDKSVLVPLIDTSKLGGPESQDSELQNLLAACRDWGMGTNICS